MRELELKLAALEPRQAITPETEAGTSDVVVELPPVETARTPRSRRG